MSDDREKLEVAKEECGRLERENDELKRTIRNTESGTAYVSRYVAERDEARAERDGLLLLINSAITEVNLWHVYDSRDTGPVFSEVVREDILEILTASTAQTLAAHNAEVAASALDEVAGHIYHNENLDLTNQAHSLSVLRHRAAEYRKAGTEGKL